MVQFARGVIAKTTSILLVAVVGNANLAVDEGVGTLLV
jgi:hypothetical protein